MAKVFSFANHKGGVGKSTAVVTLAGIFAERGKKVLLVDMDAQANLTKHLSEENFDDKEVATIYTAFKDRKSLPVYTIETEGHPSIDLVPSTIYMAGVDLLLAQVRTAKEAVLKKLLKPLRDEYDYIFLDCPPALGDVVVNAFTASDFVVVPMTTDVYAFYGIELLLQTVEEVQENSNANLQIAGIFYNRYENRTNLSKAIESTIQEQHLTVLNSVIRVDKTLREAPAVHLPASFLDPKCRAVQDFNKLADEIEVL